MPDTRDTTIRIHAALADSEGPRVLLTIGDVLLEVPACFSVSHLLLLVEALEDPST